MRALGQDRQPSTRLRKMLVERTFSIIKPDAVERNLIGTIVSRFESEGLRPVAMRRSLLSRSEAEGFYAEHSERPFFGELVDFMTRSPVVLMVLEGDNAILKNREIMGATNPADAADNTLRKLHANSIGENSVHGSDSPVSAARELNWFFKGSEVSS
jgi:nucleoside-diphosphate kinase